MSYIKCVETNEIYKSASALSVKLGRGRTFALHILRDIKANGKFEYQNLTYVYNKVDKKPTCYIRRKAKIICNQTGEIFESPTALARTLRNGTLCECYGSWIIRKLKKDGIYIDSETGYTYNYAPENAQITIFTDQMKTSNTNEFYIQSLKVLAIQLIERKAYDKAISILNQLLISTTKE